MALIISKAARLKPEIRLAEAVSRFEASLSADQKTIFYDQRALSLKNPPDTNDVMRVTAEIDRCVSGKAGKRCFGPRFTNFLQGVQQFAALGDVVVGGSQNLIACGIWSLVRMSLLSITNFSLYMDTLSSLFMEIGRSAPRYQTIAMLYPLSKTLQAHIIEYFIVVVHLCHSIRQFSLRSAVRKIAATLNDIDLKTYRSELDGWAQSIKEDVDLLVAKRVEEEAHHNSKFRALSHMFSKAVSRQQKIAAKLKVLDLCSEYDYETTWKQIRKTGTTTLFAQTVEYQQWKTKSNSGGLLHLGKLGCGKSVTMANIVEDLHVQNEEGNAVVAYFFCKHDLPESLKARTVIGALVRQLLLPLQDLPDLMDSRSHIQYKQSLDYESMAALLSRSCPIGHKRYIVLDGLDLCRKPVMAEILEELRNLQKRLPILLCISLRQQPHSSLHPAFQDWTILSADSSPDIEAFTENELIRCLETGRLKIGDPALILEIQDTLIKGSKGMFLWVALQIKSLCLMSTDEKIKEALANLPIELPDIYAQILQRVQEPDNIHQKRVLELITAARRPLTLEEVQEATSVTPGDTEWRVSKRVNNVYSVLASCGCLLTLDEEELTVRLLHPSMELFVFDQYRDSTGASLTIAGTHKTMSSILLTYLNYGIFGTEISKFCVPNIDVGLAPSKIIASTTTSSSGNVQKLALKLLKMRKQPNFDVGKALSKELAYQKKHEKAYEFHLYQYAKRWYVTHITEAQDLNSEDLSLWLALLRRRQDQHDLDSKRETSLALGLTVKTNNLEILMRLLSDVYSGEPGPEQSGPYHTLLESAALALRHRFDSSFVALLQRCESDHSTMDLFCYAAYRDEKHVVRALLQKGVLDVKYNDRHGKTPLLYAIEQGYGEMSEILLRTTRYDINAGIGELKPVFLATQSRNAIALEALLKSGGLRLTEKEGNHLLSLAKASGNARIEALIAQGSEKNWNLAPPPPPKSNFLPLYVLAMLLPEVLVTFWWFFSLGPFFSKS